MSSDKSCRVYVGNLSWNVDDEKLQEHMEKMGAVVKVQIFRSDSGRSKGCGIVTFSDNEQAQRAIKELNDTAILDRLIFVREDREEVEGTTAKGANVGFRGRGRARKSRVGRGGGRYRPQYNNDHDEEDFQGRGRGGWNRRGGYRGMADGTNSNSYGGVKLLVSNLNQATTWKDLKDLFRKAGNITRADVIPALEGERNGIVIFSNMEDANRAIETLNNFELNGSNIKVTLQKSR